MGEKSPLALEMDAIQAGLVSLFRERGYRKRGRTYNRQGDSGLVQVVNFQMGPYDPPGTVEIPGLRENLYGRFTLNLGVYVPEVAENHLAGSAKAFVSEVYCSIRARLGELEETGQDLWWKVAFAPDVLEDVRQRLERYGFPFLDRFSTREGIVDHWIEFSRGLTLGSDARLVAAIILACQAQPERARQLLREQVQGSINPHHGEYVARLAAKLGIQVL